jgi:hypothetical protein
MAIGSNPFQVRASEQAGPESRFLGLFGPSVLQLIPAERAWNRLVVFRSAPGGGKTSILRLFTPETLRTLQHVQHQELTKDLARQLTEWGIIDAQAPRLLGVLLNCDQQYASIRDISDDRAVRRRYFFALVNARIMLAALHGALVLADRRYPDDVDHVTFTPPSRTVPVAALDAFGASPGEPLQGRQVYERACAIERRICAMLDDVGLAPERGGDGHAELWALHLLGGSVHVDTTVVATRALVMFDDVHVLDRDLRAELREHLMSRTFATARWIAERWQGLTTDEMFAEGATQERDYDIVQLDGFANEHGARLTRFERTVADIANRRAQVPSLVREQAMHENTFEAFLEEPTDGPASSDDLAAAVAAARAQVAGVAQPASRYADWLADQDRRSTPTLETLREWRALEVLVRRHMNRRQGDLFGDAAVPAEELGPRKSDVLAAAELFVAQEHRLPYYYGMRRLAQLASWNIEQFLDIAGDIFDHILMAVILKKPLRISPRKQDEIVRAAARKMRDAVPRGVQHGEDVRNLLDAVGRMAVAETYRETAPYAPGVTGFALSMDDFRRLQSRDYRQQHPANERLLNALTAAVWNNLFQLELDYPCKNRRWAVFYLNRLLCAHYRLPLQYGGFREKPLTEVRQWVVPKANVGASLQLSLTTRGDSAPSDVDL